MGKVEKRKRNELKKIIVPPKNAAAFSMEKMWFKIDNAGLIYIPASNRKWTSVFRVACVLKDEIDPKILQQAADDLAPRFPSIMVNIKTGLFWYYLETASSPPKIEREVLYPCQKFDIKSGHFAVRILYSKNRIAFEAFHVITDGDGAMKYLTSLVRRYLQIKTSDEFETTGCLDYRDLPTVEETEDSFMRYAPKGKGRKFSEQKRLPMKFEKSEPGVFNVIHGQLSLKATKEVTKKLGCTIGQFITAALLYAVYQEIYSITTKPPKKNPIKIAIPINLRKKFPSETLRNFSTYINLELDHTEKQDFESILDTTKKQFEKINDDYLISSISANVAAATHPLVRAMPFFIKNLVLSAAYGRYGEGLNNLAFSNLGVVSCPSNFSDYVERFEFFLGPPKMSYLSSATACFEDKLVVTISSICKNAVIEKRFFKLLMSFGLDIIVDSNRRSDNE